MHASYGTAVTSSGTQQSLPATEHVLAELSSIYPALAYWASAEAAEEEELDGSPQQPEELDEVIFTALVGMR
jgi:hypothetical protein